MSFGSKAGGGFNELTKAYKAAPSIESYVKLRRVNPKAGIEVLFSGEQSHFSTWKLSYDDLGSTLNWLQE